VQKKRPKVQLTATYQYRNIHKFASNQWSTLFLHSVCMLRECGECAHKQHVRRTLITLT